MTRMTCEFCDRDWIPSAAHPQDGPCPRCGQEGDHVIHDPGLRACRRVGAMTTLQQAAAEVVADMDALVRDRELVTLPQSVRDLRSALAAEDARDEGIGGLVVAVARAAATFADFEVAMRL